MTNIVDYIALDEADAAHYKEIITNCAERRANAPKPERKPRAPQTLSQKITSAEKRMAKLSELIAALKAQQTDTAETTAE